MISFSEVTRVRTIFLQTVSLCYAVAFFSLYLQLPGLYGDTGLLPARSQLDTARAIKEDLWSLFTEKPTLLWLCPILGLPVESALDILCLLGTLLALASTLFPFLLTKLSLFLLWIAYLSLLHVGETFLSFQWDILLLETGFLALLAAPFLPGKDKVALAGDKTTMFLVRWLLFRMMFSSGVVKLTSDCPAWWSLTAMPTHYESQCLPTPLAWHAYNLFPVWLHKLSTAHTYVIEIVLVFLFFAPTASLRKFTFFNQVLLMFLIMLTGNYNFFNLLFIGLCFSLADDSWISSRAEKTSHPIKTCLFCIYHLGFYLGLGWLIGQAFNLKFKEDFTVESSINFSRSDLTWFLSLAVPFGIGLGLCGLTWSILMSLVQEARSWKSFSKKTLAVLEIVLYAFVAFAMFFLSLPSFTRQLDRPSFDKIPPLVHEYDRKLGNFHLTSSYGLFRRMTGVGGRPEVILEGCDSLHGEWEEFRFKYKPGNLSLAPEFMLPHQPRLDWQMWFAALGSPNHNPWLLSLVYKLLEGEPTVLDLLHPSSPFVDTPPKYLRAKIYKYHFTGQGSDWWTRDDEKEYLPVLDKGNKQLKHILESQGRINLPKERRVQAFQKSLFKKILVFIRNLVKSGPPDHIQIWSFSWLALPILKSFVL